MQARFGLLAVAERVFPVSDVVLWNSLIAGYAHLGDSEGVFIFFEKCSKIA